MSRPSLPLSIAAFACLLVPMSAAGQQASIAWRSDLAAARHEAVQSGRNLLVHFWAPWCGPCRRLETNVFNQQAVTTTVQQGLIPVKLNADEFPQVARAYGVERLPTDLILRPDGAVLAKFGSPQDPSRYLAHLTPFCTTGGVPEPAAKQLQTANGATPNRRRPVHPAYADLQLPSQEATHEVTAGYSDAAPMGRPMPTVSAGYGDPTRSRGYAASNASRAVGSQADGDRTIAYRGHLPRGAQGTPTPNPQFQQDPPSGPAGGTAYGSRYSSYQTGQSTTAPVQASPRRPDPMATAAATTATQSVGVAPHSAATRAEASRAPAADGSTTSAAAPPAASNRSSLGIDGFCPVTLKHQQRWVPGDQRYGIIHRGRLYLFAGPQQQQQFWADPDGYSPVLSGIDPVLALDNGATVEGQREHGVEYDGHIYLFSSESTLQHFSRNPERYAGGVRQAMQRRTGTALR